MAWNPSPKVADCREVAKKWKVEQVIIIGIDGEGMFTCATYGRTPVLCKCTDILGGAAMRGMEAYIKAVESKGNPT